MKVVNGFATAFGVLLALTPVIILVGRRRDKSDEATDADEASDAVAAAGEESAEGTEGVESAEKGAQTAEIVADEDAVEPKEEEVVATDDLDDDVSIADTGDFQFDPDEFEDAGSDELFEIGEDEPKA